MLPALVGACCTKVHARFGPQPLPAGEAERLAARIAPDEVVPAFPEVDLAAPVCRKQAKQLAARTDKQI